MGDHDVVTSPESFPQPPSTPPDTDEKVVVDALALSVLKLCKDLRQDITGDEPWRKLVIDEVQYTDFEQHLELHPELSGYVKDKLR